MVGNNTKILNKLLLIHIRYRRPINASSPVVLQSHGYLTSIFVDNDTRKKYYFKGFLELDHVIVRKVYTVQK